MSTWWSVQLDRADSGSWSRVVARLLSAIVATAEVLASVVLLLERFLLWAWVVVLCVMERVLLSIVLPVLSVIELRTVLPDFVNLRIVAVLIILLIYLRCPLNLVRFFLGDGRIRLGFSPATSTELGLDSIIFTENIQVRMPTGSVMHLD